jgi:hypothetical protein
MLQGSYNGTTWIDLYNAAATPSNSTTNVTASGIALANSFILQVAKNGAAYSYYRTLGVGAASLGAGIASEVYFDINTAAYQASLFPKFTICSNDIDGDGIPNFQDLDSDGDGCPDAKESGVIGTLSSGAVKNGTGGVVTSTTTTPNSIAGTTK